MNKIVENIILSTSLLVTTPVVANLSVPKIQERVIDILDDKKNYQEEIIKNADKYLIKYDIKRGDTFDKIINKFWLSKNELINIRKLTETLTKRWVSFLVAWEEIYVPENYNNLLAFENSVSDINKSIKNIEKNEAFKNWDKEKLNQLTDRTFFPKTVKNIWIDNLSEWIIWNMSINPLNTYNPQFVDTLYEEFVNCAWMMRWFYGYSIAESNRSRWLQIYLGTENIDAWELSKEFKKIWFTQEYNFMTNFNYKKIWSKNIIQDISSYNRDLLEMWNEFNNWSLKKGSLLLAYFKLSNYKDDVRDYNKYRSVENKSINTHAMIYLWSWSINIKSWEIKDVENWKILDLEKSKKRDIIEVITDYIQQRWWYNSALTNKTKNDIIKNLHYFSELLNIEVNWVKINIKNELNLKRSDRFKIESSDDIKITWWIVWDWFHDVLSDNYSLVKENNFRTAFFWESVLINSYTYSELLEAKWLEKTKSKTNIELLIEELKITNFYDLKAWENVNIKLNESILRYKFDKGEELEITDEENKLLEVISRNKNYNKKYSARINYRLVEKLKEKINKIKSTLNSNEKRLFKREYKNQIKGLQLYGYLQTEWKNNKWTQNVNAPIPYFDTNWIEEIYDEYIDYKRYDLEKEYKTNKNNFIHILFLPWDNSAKVFTAIEQQLSNYIKEYPNFEILSSLNVLQKKYFLEKIIDQEADNSKIDVSNWIFNAFDWVYVWIEKINEVIEEIINQSFIEEFIPSALDEEVINKIVHTKSDFSLLSHSLSKESYVTEWNFPKRKSAKIIAVYLKEISEWKLNWVSSYWDFQMKFFNLLSKDVLTKWPTNWNILEAINAVNSERFIEIISRRESNTRYKEIIEKDNKILDQIFQESKYIEELKKNINWLEDEEHIKRLEKDHWIFIFKSFKKLFRFDDGSWSNIIWKIMQASLLKDKLNLELENIINWSNKWWITVDEIFNSVELKTIIEKMRLLTNNKSEKQTLDWISENYILRILSTIDDINSPKYPTIEISKKKQLINNTSERINRLKEYKKIIISLNKPDLIDVELKNLIINYLDDLINSKLNVNVQFKLFKDIEIKKYLESKWEELKFFPNLEELKWGSDFRNKFFRYTRFEEWKVGPKINKLDYITWTEFGRDMFWGMIGSTMLILWLAFRKKIKWFFWKKTNKNEIKK